MKRTAIKIFSGTDCGKVEKDTNRFLTTVEPDDVVTILNSQYDHSMQGTGLRAQDYYTVHTVTVVYRYDYTQAMISDELNELDAEIYRLLPGCADGTDSIFLAKYSRALPVKMAWGISKADMLADIKKSEQYRTLRQEIIDKWYAGDKEWNSPHDGKDD